MPRIEIHSKRGFYGSLLGLVAVAAVACTLWGAGLELVQSTPWIQRSGDIYDAMANGLGALAGVLVWRHLLEGRFLQRQER